MDRLVISTENKLKNYFEALIYFLVAYSCLTSLYAVAFAPPKGNIRYFDIAVDILFCVDLVLSFFKAYVD